MDIQARSPTRPDLRILHVARGREWSDVEMQVLNVARSINRHAYASCSVVLFNNGRLSEALRKAGVNVVVFDETRIRPLVLMQHIVRVIRAFNPIVVHTHGQKENLIGGLAAHIAKSAVSVRTAHATTDQALSSGGITDFLDRFAARRLQRGTFYVSREQAIHSDLHGTGARKPVVIPESVDLQALSVLRKARPWSENSVKVCFLAEPGAAACVMDAEIFARTANVFSQRFDIQSSFDLFGDCPEREHLKQLGGKNFRLKGPTPDRARTLRDYDFLMVPSRHQTTPLAVIEAMALGVGVVAADGGSIAEALNHGECGSLVNGSTPEAFSLAIAESLRDPRKIRSVTLEHAARRVKNFYSSEVQCDLLLDQYRSVITESDFWRIHEAEAVSP